MPTTRSPTRPLSPCRAFGNFITIILISLTFLVPDQSPSGLGTTMIIYGLIAAIETARTARVFPREKPHLTDLLGSGSAIGRLGIWAASTIGLLVIAVTIHQGSTAYLGWLVGVVRVILISAADNSWSLLLDIAKAKRHIAERKPVPGAAAGTE